MAPRFTPADIRRYYDTNTAAFVRHGQGGQVGAIHRAVWGPGVTDRAQAFRYVEDRIAAQIDALPLAGPAHVVDLGCGVAASLIYLAGQRPIRGTGITISPVQAQLAAARVADAGLADRVRVLEGDYCALPGGIEYADVAYAIESFVHGPSPERFFTEAARVVRPGGLLIVCDDVRRDTDDPAATRTIARFTRGWHVNSLLTADALRAAAAAAGFAHEATTDLTPWLELQRPRDRAIDLLAALVGWLPGVSTRLAPLVGGSALQTGLARGWIAYEIAVFRR